MPTSPPDSQRGGRPDLELSRAGVPVRLVDNRAAPAPAFGSGSGVFQVRPDGYVGLGAGEPTAHSSALPTDEPFGTPRRGWDGRIRCTVVASGWVAQSAMPRLCGRSRDLHPRRPDAAGKRPRVPQAVVFSRLPPPHGQSDISTSHSGHTTTKKAHAYPITAATAR